MVETKIEAPKDVVERNIDLVGYVMKYLLEQPEVFESLPDDFEMVILPEDDPEIRQFNLQLLDRYGSEGKPVVFARVPGDTNGRSGRAKPTFYVPVAA